MADIIEQTPEEIKAEIVEAVNSEEENIELLDPSIPEVDAQEKEPVVVPKSGPRSSEEWARVATLEAKLRDQTTLNKQLQQQVSNVFTQESLQKQATEDLPGLLKVLGVTEDTLISAFMNEQVSEEIEPYEPSQYELDTKARIEALELLEKQKQQQAAQQAYNQGISALTLELEEMVKQDTTNQWSYLANNPNSSNIIRSALDELSNDINNSNIDPSGITPEKVLLYLESQLQEQAKVVDLMRRQAPRVNSPSLSNQVNQGPTTNTPQYLSKEELKAATVAEMTREGFFK